MVERPPALSPEALCALTAYRETNPMPEPARERVHARLQARRTVAPAPSRPAWLWAAGGAIAAGLLVWGAIGASDALRASADDGSAPSLAPMQVPSVADEAAQTRPIQAVSPRLEPAHELAPAPLQVLEKIAEPPQVPQTPATALPRAKRKENPVPAPVPTPPALPATRLGAENQLIARTWEHVRALRYGKARETLTEHASEFPVGVLAPERRALQVIVACLEHPEAAAGRADAYAAQGHSTLLAKVRAACTREKSAPK